MTPCPDSRLMLYRSEAFPEDLLDDDRAPPPARAGTKYPLVVMLCALPAAAALLISLGWLLGVPA